jgi:hypothetical protein
MDNKYTTLDTINTNHFYCGSIDDIENGMGYDNIFPTLDDAKKWVDEALDEFNSSVIGMSNIVVEIREYTLSEKDFNFINGDIDAFFDNQYELPYKVIEF